MATELTLEQATAKIKELNGYLDKRKAQATEYTAKIAELEEKLQADTEELEHDHDAIAVRNQEIAEYLKIIEDLKPIAADKKEALEIAKFCLEEWASITPEQLTLKTLAIEFNNVYEKMKATDALRLIDLDESEKKVQQRLAIANASVAEAVENLKIIKSNADQMAEKIAKSNRTLTEDLKQAKAETAAAKKLQFENRERVLQSFDQVMQRPQRVLEIWGESFYQEAKNIYSLLGGNAAELPPPFVPKPD